ncbi:glycosyltransferase family protein [Clostridium estertheticum]|uniref:Glycosyltransferase like family protein n=1 Tax=Clostridium estertheticum subsp. estertheticum TaxID=1552 RepID=A0A1J0GJN5_9CLOT|nr:glycosyltransferase family protein [Clostridium estertheticum]APC41618.1 glycosyltransferase like family protein [Clostridium estertheticum subsp. estertheticum]MBU3076091.1 glycosyltransferase family protein [Clostridium estertheticum]MBU3166185.1 glycosyltransferase family protein [Clostridium estertheticum]MBZ9616514.1 glycosyltransferase family protein [Clostridium estertheticum subsp. laramiense]WAG72241.1 glycosyltransferase family protein [Clostridium estertheticum]
MNSNKIAFISFVLNKKQYKKCVSNINNLEVPLGFELQVISISDTDSYAEAYNRGVKLTDAKYKVFLHSNTYIVNKSFIADVLNIFIDNNNIGLIGVVGAKRLPDSGLWWEDVGKVGEVCISRSGSIELLKFNNIIEKYDVVEAIDGLIMVTQNDIPWREDIFDGLHFYDISECMEFKKSGLKIVVPRQEKTWCIHDYGTEDSLEEQGKKFLKEYSIISNRNIRESEDLFDFKREDAMNVLVENKKILENYVLWMKNSLLLGDYESASRNAYGFAEKASLYHPGFYMSPEIENMLLVCANNLQQNNYVIKDKNIGKRKVLHVLSEGYPTGGHTRLLSNWIEADADSIHSLVTTWQIETTPQWVLEKIEKAGGWTYSLADVGNKYVDRAAKLRKLAYEWADIVVLHMHMMDPIPVMAFGVEGGPPIIYMNHGDHCFWLGASIADLVVDMRTSGQELTLSRRSCINSCILPIPLQTKKTFDRNIIRQKYNIGEKETVILTIASNYKFRSINDNNYINILKQVVDKTDNCRAYIIGPTDEGKWHDIGVETNGKIKALGLLTEIEDFYKIADVYLDCFMMGSMTSLLDAAIYGLYIIKFTNYHCPILTEFDEEFKTCSYNNINEIIQEIKEIKNGSIETYNKYTDINNSIRKNHILDTQDKIINIYNMVNNHKVNKELTIKNEVEDYDLFWSLLIKNGYVY